MAHPAQNMTPMKCVVYHECSKLRWTHISSTKMSEWFFMRPHDQQIFGAQLSGKKTGLFLRLFWNNEFQQERESFKLSRIILWPVRKVIILEKRATLELSQYCTFEILMLRKGHQNFPTEKVWSHRLTMDQVTNRILTTDQMKCSCEIPTNCFCYCQVVDFTILLLEQALPLIDFSLVGSSFKWLWEKGTTVDLDKRKEEVTVLSLLLDGG